MNVEKLFKSRKTLLEMIETRGFNVESLTNYSFDEIRIMLSNHSKSNKDRSPLDIMLNSDKGQTVFVKYILTPKIRLSNIRTLIEHFIEEMNSGDTFIAIITEPLTYDDSFEEYVNNIYLKKKIFIQYFYINTITFNVTHHDMVPKHELISEDEKNKLVHTLNITDISKLPKIKKTDPIAKYYGMKLGDVTRIYRPSGTSGISIYYRLCE